MKLVIRPVRNDEAADLFEIHRAVFRSHIDQLWGWDEQWQKANFSRELESSITSTVSVDDRVIGYLQCCEEGDRIYIRNIALSAQYQCRGIGALLIKDVQKRAAASGISVELGVFRTNAAARRFYERLGFVRTHDSATHIHMSWSAA
ncbi:GNAT family N-acetyltransferase [Halopseudomonas nanhaiensis]|uniref:GNAT family N-acetyltransferase n=1 Tax=Halopseudomonas nanhaiensis TaxID=2830842 RepID=UPI001CBD8DE9|nr:GNAT family N-acetyltransferase [Halopseudomonas nanhaiensis]UAW97810.1 GNAT family N-acetyltransferase [Halopseudomonas nanhaiensis]